MIWVIGGTVNSREICELLKQQQYQAIVTTATSFGGNMANVPEGFNVKAGMLDRGGDGSFHA